MAEQALPRRLEGGGSLVQALKLNWETIAWAVIVALTVATRLYALGERVMSHDESLHTYYAWKLYFGQGYQHDPMMHGPLLYHATALIYALVGPSDFTARLFSALLGLGLVVSPLLLRKWLGGVGAVAVGVMLLISPTVMYYSRYIRHDIHVELFTVLMAAAFIRFIDARANRWIVVAFAAAALAIASAEMAYINGFVLVTFIVLALLIERLAPRAANMVGIGLASVGLGLLVFSSLASMGILASVADFSQGTPKSIMQVSLLFSGLCLIYGLTATLLVPFRSPAEDADPPEALVLADLVVSNMSRILFGIGVVALVVGGGVAYRSCGAAAVAPMVGTLSGCRLAAAILAAGGVVFVYGLLGLLLDRYEERALASAIGRAPVRGILAGVGVAVVIYVLLYTTFFTNMEGIRGMVRSISYWLEQHGVVRGDQPFYYYGLFTPMYEFLPVFTALAGGWAYLRRWDLRVARGNDGGSLARPSAAAAVFVPLLCTWAAGVFWVYSWAGEKMPWLIVHLVVPLTFLAGRYIADVVEAVDWQALRGRWWQIAGLAALALVVAGFTLVRVLLAGQSGELAGAMAGLLLLGLCAWGLIYVGRGVEPRQVVRLVGLALAALLLVWNARVSFTANFVNAEDATEYIVYAHGTPDDKDVYELLKATQDRMGAAEKLKIGYDNEVSWPFTWYFREDNWPETPHYLGEAPASAADLKNLDAILIGSPNYSKFEPYLRNDFASVEYRRMWWPNEGYKGYSISQEGWNNLLKEVTDPKRRRNWLNILLYRKYTTDPMADVPEPKSMDDWFHHANMKLFVKRERVEKVWPDAAARPASVQPGQESVLAQAPPLQVPIDQTFETGPDGKPLAQPKGIELDAEGNLWVVDHANQRIVEFGSDGKAKTVVAAGELKATGKDNAGKMTTESSAWGVEVGPDGAVYVADTWNHRVVKYKDGKQVLAFGAFDTIDTAKPTEKLGAFWGPRDVALDDQGKIYVADTGNKRIQVFDPTGQPLGAYGGAGLNPGQLNEPTSIAFDPATGQFYVADLWNLRVQVFDRNFAPLRQWEVDGWESQDAPFKAYIAVGPGGTVVVTDPAAARVWVYGPEGKPLGTLDLPMDDRGLKEPIGVDVDGQGRIYVASSGSNVVTRYGPPQPFADIVSGTPVSAVGAATATGSPTPATPVVAVSPTAPGLVPTLGEGATGGGATGAPRPPGGP